MMQLEYKVNPNDLLEALRGKTTSKTAYKIGTWIFFIWFVTTGILSLIGNPSFWGSYFMIAYAILLPPINLFWRYRVHQICKSRPSMRDYTTLEVLEKGLLFKSRNYEAEFNWQIFTEMIETKNLLLIYRSKLIFQIVPKRAFSTTEQLNEFRKMLDSKLPMSQGDRSDQMVQALIPDLMQPLTPGNIVTLATSLYRSDFKTYLRLSLFAHLWLLVPIYGWAKHFKGCGVISRLAFRSITGKPESAKAAQNQLKPRLWSFLRVGLQVWTITSTILLVGLVFSTAILLFLFSTFRWTWERDSLLSLLLVVLLCSIGLIVMGLSWYYARWGLLAEVSLSVDERVTGAQSIARSGKLTKGFLFRIQTIFVLAWLLSVPLVILLAYLPYLILSRLELDSFEIVSWSYGVMGILGSVVIMPFWQAIKAVLYCDLWSRQTGLMRGSDTVKWDS